MRTKSVFSILVLSAVVVTFGLNTAYAGFPLPPLLPGLPPPNVNVRIDGYLPAPPGVNVQIDSGRPYYVERERRVYIEREPARRYYKKRHYKKAKRHHEDNGREHGHDKHGH
ncbi:MAG: hypothetical protein WC007_06965 [Pelobacteraceae bacterium]